MKNLISTLIQNESQGKNGSLYYQSYNSSISLGDESGHEITIWERSFSRHEEEDEDLCNEIMSQIREAAEKELYTIIDDSLIMQTDKDDMIKLHISDRSIHLIKFYSGQY